METVLLLTRRYPSKAKLRVFALLLLVLYWTDVTTTGEIPCWKKLLVFTNINILFSVTGRSLVHRCSTECVVSECDLETSKMRRARVTRTVER